MAGDWIKMRTDLYRDPKVIVIADLLMAAASDLSRHVSQSLQCNMAVTRNVTRNAVVGALVSVWGVLRHRGKRDSNDLVVKGCAISAIDDVADIPGFGEAMRYVGWVEQINSGLRLPRFFEEFNVDPSEDENAKNAARQRRFRAKLKATKSNVTVTSQSNVRVEKRRDKENITKESNGQATKPTVDDVRAYCLERKNGIDPEAFVDHYTANGWMVGKSRMKDWRAAVRTWEKNSTRKPHKPRLNTPEEDAVWTPY